MALGISKAARTRIRPLKSFNWEYSTNRDSIVGDFLDDNRLQLGQ